MLFSPKESPRDVGVRVASLQLMREMMNAGLKVSTGEVEAVAAQMPQRDRILFTRSWALTTTIGSPPAALFDAFLVAVNDESARQRDIRRAVAGPAAATRIIVVLPLVSLVILGSLGFNAVGVLFTTVVGWLCLLIAAALTVIGFRWSARLVSRARACRHMPGVGFELVAMGISAGVGLERVTGVMGEVGLLQLAPIKRESDRAHQAVSATAHLGIPVAELLRALADNARQQENARVSVRLMQLGEKILLPLGACILPAFILLVAVPAVYSTLLATTPV